MSAMSGKMHHEVRVRGVVSDVLVHSWLMDFHLHRDDDGSVHPDAQQTLQLQQANQRG